MLRARRARRALPARWACRARRGPEAGRARWLLLSYPKTWRERYGDEFAELLAADIEERPRSWRRTEMCCGMA
ncbi:MAG: hypothetical protein ACXVW7_06715 [Trebonia sp.]